MSTKSYLANGANSWLLIGLLVALSGSGCGRDPAVSDIPDSPDEIRDIPVERAVKLSMTGHAWNGQYSVVDFKEPFSRCLSESLRAFRRLQFKVNTGRSRRSRNGARLHAVNKDKLECEVHMKALPKGGTRVSVKVGVLGDRNGSERYLEELRRGLDPK